jgi:DNA-binding CsgD family transcriptional regulator
MVTRQLFERDGELNLLRELLASSLRREGQVVSISGALAIGKTELLHCFADEAARAGVRFILASGSRAEQALPFGIGRQLFRGAAPASLTARGLSFMLEQGTISTSPKREAASAESPTISMVSKLGTALLELAELDPLIVAVEDVQYADLASLDLLLYLARRVGPSRMLVIITQGGPADQRFEAELFSRPHCSRITLGPLSSGGVARMISERTGVTSAAPLASAYHAITGGNPLLVRALIEDQPAVGRVYEEVVLRCLYRSTPDMLLVAQAFAILGESASSSLAGHLMGIDPDAADQATRALTEAGLLCLGQFRHPAAHNVALRSLSADRRDALHHQAACLSFAAGATTAAVAQHLVAVGRVAEPWECDVLRDAAEQALSDSEPEFAVACLRLLLQASGTEPRRVIIGILLARAEWQVNPLAASRRLGGVTDAISAGQLTGHLAVWGIMLLLWCGRLAEATRALDHLVSHDDAHRDAAHELNAVKGWLTYAHPPLRTRVPSLTAAENVVDLRPAADGPLPRATQVLAAALHGGPAGRTRPAGAHDQILQQSQPYDHSMSEILAALLALIYADRPDKAAAWSDALLQRAPARLAPTWHALLTGVQAKISLHVGDLPAAETLALTALEKISPQSWGIAVGDPLAVLVQATTAMGNLAEAAVHLSRPVPEAMFESMSGLHYLQAKGRYELATSRPAAALDSFQACGDLMIRWQIDRPSIVPWRSDAARALIMLGEQRRAMELASAQMNILEEDDARTRGASLRVRGLASDLPQRRSLLQQAVDLLQTSGDRVELKYALTDLSRTHYALGEFNRARLTRRRAHRLALECRIQPRFELLQPETSAEVHAPATEPSAPADPGNALSEAEFRVAVLAAQGDTNREIAGKLYITVSTVEQHLTRIYRKLSIRQRRDLPVSLRRRAAESATG